MCDIDPEWPMATDRSTRILPWNFNLMSEPSERQGDDEIGSDKSLVGVSDQGTMVAENQDGGEPWLADHEQGGDVEYTGPFNLDNSDFPIGEPSSRREDPRDQDEGAGRVNDASTPTYSPKPDYPSTYIPGRLKFGYISAFNPVSPGYSPTNPVYIPTSPKSGYFSASIPIRCRDNEGSHTRDADNDPHKTARMLNGPRRSYSPRVPRYEDRNRTVWGRRSRSRSPRANFESSHGARSSRQRLGRYEGDYRIRSPVRSASIRSRYSIGDSDSFSPNGDGEPMATSEVGQYGMLKGPRIFSDVHVREGFTEMKVSAAQKGIVDNHLAMFQSTSHTIAYQTCPFDWFFPEGPTKCPLEDQCPMQRVCCAVKGLPSDAAYGWTCSEPWNCKAQIHGIRVPCRDLIIGIPCRTQYCPLNHEFMEAFKLSQKSIPTHWDWALANGGHQDDQVMNS